MVSFGRCTIGAAMLLAPDRVARLWLGDSGGPGSRPLVRAMGVRDVVLGLGALEALDHEGDARSWVAAGAACDAVDAGALVLASRDLPGRAWGVVLLAASAAVLGGRAATDLG